jgi:hypothetical protein
VTTGPDPGGATAAASSGRALVRWSSVVVLLALLIVAAAAWFADRGCVEQSDGVSFIVEGAAPPGAGTSPGPASPTAGSPPASRTPGPEGSATPATAEETPTTVTSQPSTTATADPGSSATTSPTPAPTEVPPRVTLSSTTVGIGETFAVRVLAPEAGSASVIALGRSYPLLAEDAGSFLGVIGIPLNAALGPSLLVLTIRDDFGTVLEEQSVGFEVTTVERPIDYLELTAEQGSVLTPEAAALEVQLRTEQFLTFDRPRRWSGLFRLPAQGFDTTEFGQGRSINGGPVGGFHSGADIANEAGTPIQAAAPGRVSWAGEMPIRGNTVIVDHGAGVKTGYHHLQAILVAVDQELTAGTVVGEMGSTGLSTGPHLHWELTVYGVNVDPKTWTTTDFTN